MSGADVANRSRSWVWLSFPSGCTALRMLPTAPELLDSGTWLRLTTSHVRRLPRVAGLAWTATVDLILFRKPRAGVCEMGAVRRDVKDWLV